MKSKIIVTGIIFLLSLGLSAKNNPFTKGNDVFGSRVFIENKGQFNHEAKTSEPIMYALDNGDEKIYFTAKGLIYKLIKYAEVTEKQMEAMEQGKKLKPADVYFVNMSWANANPDIQIEESDKQRHYFTYGPSDLNSSCFKKITYKNVYKGIDIEYTIPENKICGVKYSVILHPGANPADVQIIYSGDVKKIIQRGNDVIVKTPLDDIIEHAPSSFYEGGEEVASNFVMSDNSIGFQFPAGYQNNKTLIVDPWVTNITTLSTNNYGYDVDYDLNGNLYVFGGFNPKVSKYDNIGTLLWTFGGVVVAPPWNSMGNFGPSLKIVGNFVVDKLTGKTYVGEGYNSTGTQAIRIDGAGNYNTFISTKVSTWQEIWDMGFHCASGKVYGLGGGTNSNLSVGLIDTTTGSCAPITLHPTGPVAGQDIACNTIDDAGNVFVYYASGNPALNNNIARVNAAFTATVWGAFCTYNSLNEGQNKNNYAGAGGLFSNGFNCLAVNSNFIYYYDGFNLAAFSKTTGVKIGFTTIPGNVIKTQGGIAVDDCDNVYIGGNGNIDSYHFNGTSFTALPSIALGVANPFKYVYDIKLDKNYNLLYITGSGFVGTYSAISSLTCTSNQFVITTNCVGNNNGTAVASVTTTLASPLYTYLWSNGGGTVSVTNNTTSATNTVTGLTNGIYTVTIKVNAPCGPIYSGTVNVNCITVCAGVAFAQTGCSGANTTFSLNFGTTTGFTSTPTYTWTGPGAFNSNLQNPVFTNGAFGVYTITASDGNCTYSTTVNTVNSLVNPTITPTGTVTCTSGATLTANFVNAPYTYNWSGPSIVGPNNLQSAIVNMGGTYSVSITNTLTGCVGTATVNISQNAAVPSVTVSPISGNLSCNGAPACFTAVCSPTVNVQGQWFDPSIAPIGALSNSPVLLCANQPGVYTCSFVNITNGCVGTGTVTVTSNSAIPTMTINALNGYVITCSKPCLVMNISTSSTLAPKSYSWTNMSTTVTTTPPTGGYTICTPGNYLAEFMDGNFCRISQMITISIDTVRPSPSVLTGLPSNSYTLDCYHPCITPTVISNPLLSPGSYSWTTPPNLTVNSNTVLICLPNIASSITPTTYTAIAIGANGCIGKAKILFYKNIYVPPYTIVFTPTSITCSNNFVAMSPQTTTSVAATYTFISPAPTTTSNLSGALFNIPGTYTMNYTNVSNGCTGSVTTNVPINITPPPIVPLATATLVCGSNTVLLSAGTTSNLTNYQYSWTGPLNAAFTTPTLNTTQVNMPGTYFVSITNTITGCNSVNQVEVVLGGISVSFTPNPSQGFSPLSVTFPNNTILGSASSGTVYTWWGYGNGATNSYTNASAFGSPNGSATYPTAGTYTVLLVVTQSVTVAGNTTGCTATATAIVVVDLPSKLTVPNIFTPNGDGVNDFFIVQSTNITEIDCIIFDRWGVKMYDVKSNTGNISWDGKTLFGKDVPAGTYFYLINADGKDGATYKQNGSFSLYR